jgi:hemerythrin-like domain-containing protein
MIEHRLIERMISVIRKTLTEKEPAAQITPVFVDSLVDFMHVYADLTHHGKEEGILFRELQKLSLFPIDQEMMNDLTKEHILARNATTSLKEANDLYRKGDALALEQIENNLRILVDFYPGHIEKEDKVFFPACRTYFTAKEDQKMLAEFMGFDQKMIHEKYKLVVQEVESRS